MPAGQEMAYGLWTTAHGMAMLQLTHLRQFKADFVDHDRRVLEAYVRGLGQGYFFALYQTLFGL